VIAPHLEGDSVAEAIGQSARFLQIYEEYKKAPEVIRKRMYLESMERVLGGTDKIILYSQRRQGAVPSSSQTEAKRPAEAGIGRRSRSKEEGRRSGSSNSSERGAQSWGTRSAVTGDAFVRANPGWHRAPLPHPQR